MKNLAEFETQLLALGMEPIKGETLETIHKKFITLKDSPEQTSELFKVIQPVKLELDWDDSTYIPEPSLKKRCVTLSEAFVEEANGQYPKQINEDLGDHWHHLVMHGKCGLMALLFSLEKKDASLKCSDIAPMIETFMSNIDEAFDQCLQQKNTAAIEKALRISSKKDQSFNEFIQGRLQAFALMRSLYLGDKTKELSPLQWWVQHERYIPALPE